MTQRDIIEELRKCNNSPYYFATTYLKVKNHKGESVPFRTFLDETSFNKVFNTFKKWNRYGRNIRKDENN